MRLAALWLVACSSATSPPVAVQNQAAPRPDSCDQVKTARVIAAKGEAVRLAGDKRLVYQGSSQDHHQDGSWAVVLEPEVAGSPWLPDLGDTVFHRIDGRCMRIVRLVGDALELQVEAAALAPPKEPDCRMNCCETEASRQPAPGGEYECCMCPTD